MSRKRKLSEWETSTFLAPDVLYGLGSRLELQTTGVRQDVSLLLLWKYDYYDTPNFYFIFPVGKPTDRDHETSRDRRFSISS